MLEIYMVYIDFIMMLIIEVLSFTFAPISTFSGLVRCSNACLLAILYKIYMVYRDCITMFINEVLSFNITPISVSEIQ